MLIWNGIGTDVMRRGSCVCDLIRAINIRRVSHTVSSVELSRCGAVTQAANRSFPFTPRLCAQPQIFTKLLFSLSAKIMSWVAVTELLHFSWNSTIWKSVWKNIFEILRTYYMIKSTDTPPPQPLRLFFPIL